MRKKLAKLTASEAEPTPPPAPRFIEIVNWKKAQPRMKGRDNPWMKLYTSLLDNDAFAAMDDRGRMLIVALWLYAARSGQSILPADPAWLRRKIPLLNNDPDLRPLLNAQDVYGNATPFIRYCKPPKPRKPRRPKSEDSASAEKGEESRVEERREEERRREQTGDGRAEPEEKRREQKKQETAASQRQTEPQQPAVAQEQRPGPEDPPESDALGRAKGPARDQDPAPGSVNIANGSRRLRYPISEAVYDQHDIIVGGKVYRALRLFGNPDMDDEAYSEVTSFASVWHEIRVQACRSPPEIVNQLAVRAIHQAHRIGKSKRKQNKSAVWISTIRKIASAKL